MKASAAIENEGTGVLSVTYNLQDVPYEQFPFRAYSIHKMALWTGFEVVAVVPGIIRRGVVNSSWRETRGGTASMQYPSLLGLLVS